MKARFLSRLLADQQGTSITEFAMIAPALCMTLFGLFELSHTVYTSTMLEGAIQKAARNSTLEGAAIADGAIDTNVSRAVHRIVPGASIHFARKAYAKFADVSQPEDYNDLNENGICDNGEPFEDANGSGTWDEDRGLNGAGGARDAVLYEVTVSYDRMFPAAAVLGFAPTVTTQASTVLRNQPYSEQNERAGVGNCA